MKRFFCLLFAAVIVLCSSFMPASPYMCGAFATAVNYNSDYITPEQFGAAGDGVTDDTRAFEKCLKSPVKDVYLAGDYLISEYIFSPYEKSLFSDSGKKSRIICNVPLDSKALAFYGSSQFDNIIFESSVERTGTSPHGEKYKKTSNIVLVEIWENSGIFNNCDFINGLTAIRGRKSSDSDDIPESITVNNCTFTECKIPVQGYSKNTFVKNCSFFNDGDLYSGDHCVYIERFGCKSLTVSDSQVDTLNTDSGAAFQIYGTAGINDEIPSLTVSDCIINANGVASVSEADVIIDGVEFNAKNSERYIATAVSGSVTVKNSSFTHSRAFTYADTCVKPVAENCTFTLDTSLTGTRCNYPFESRNCNYINWGGNVRLDGTSFSGCRFTKTGEHPLDNLYVRDTEGYKVSFTDCAFDSGDTVINDDSVIIKWENCSTDGNGVNPQDDIPVFEIRNYKSSITVDYKSTLVFHTTISAPDGYKIIWSENAEGSEYIISRATRDEYRISAKLIRLSDGVAVKATQTETVYVRHRLFSKIIAFFRQLLNILPMFVDNISQ